MPSKCKSICTYPGCGVLTHSTRCDAHKYVEAKAYDKQRGTAASRGYDSRWTRYSKRYRRENPLCVDCLKDGILTCVENGGHVDHIQAVTGPDDPLFWEPSNHTSRCASCHSKKTILEDGGFKGKNK